MKALLVSTLLAHLAFGTLANANAGLLIDATKGPISIVVDGR